MWPNAVAAGVFSAHAEVVPYLPTSFLLHMGILRARGGSSGFMAMTAFNPVYSPRTRR